MRILTPQEVKDLAAAGTQRVVCIDVRLSQSHNLYRVQGGLKIPFNALASRIYQGQLEQLRGALVVVCGMRPPERCETVKGAMTTLENAGFEVAAMANGVTGWNLAFRNQPMPGL